MSGLKPIRQQKARHTSTYYGCFMREVMVNAQREVPQRRRGDLHLARRQERLEYPGLHVLSHGRTKKTDVKL